jgi:hypothetical protein
MPRPVLRGIRSAFMTMPRAARGASPKPAMRWFKKRFDVSKSRFVRAEGKPTERTERIFSLLGNPSGKV